MVFKNRLKPSKLSKFLSSSGNDKATTQLLVIISALIRNRDQELTTFSTKSHISYICSYWE